MKRLLIILIFSFVQVNGQSNVSDADAFQLLGGYEKDGFMASFSYHKFINFKRFWAVGVQGNRAEYKDKRGRGYKTNATTILIKADYNIALHQEYHGFYNIYLGGGLRGGYNIIKKIDPIEINAKTAAVYGVGVNIQADVYLMEVYDRPIISLVFNAGQDYLLNREQGEWIYNLSAGIRITY